MFNNNKCCICGIQDPDILLEVTIVTKALGKKSQTDTYEVLENLNQQSSEVFCQDCFAKFARAIESFRLENTHV